MKWLVVLALFFLGMVALTSAEGEVWEEDDHEVLIRSERGAKNRDNCRYVKGAWTECDPKTNMRSRTLTLKKGDQNTCEQTKTIQKKCKKNKPSTACRYVKGQWSECSPENRMTRTDTLKANSDPSCDLSRQISKKCKTKGAKDNKGGRRNRQ